MRPWIASLFVVVWVGGLVAQTEPAADTRSVERIRVALTDDRPRLVTDLDMPATFHVDIRESRRFGELTPPFVINSGPTPPGGLYMYEHLKRTMPGWTPPLASVDILPAAGVLVSAIGAFMQARRVEAARAEVREAIRAYCAARGDVAAAIQICAMAPAAR
jgi:hypothetical protein